MYVSRRTRADCATLMARRVVALDRKAAGHITSDRSVFCQRSRPLDDVFGLNGAAEYAVGDPEEPLAVAV